MITTTDKLNLKYYKGSDVYSDGDIELEILKMVQENEDFSEVLQKDNRWAVLYHLTPLRRNLLEWYDFDKNAEVLEIGAGMGAFTGLLCEKTKHVTAVELSKTRASIIAERTKKYDNLEIIVGNLNDIEFDRKFDYITLIGVLEYAGKYTDSKNPYFDFLNNIKKLLKPDGTLVIAIENKFGLKYWAGANEDHTGRLFDSIENYPKNVGIETFGKYELEELIRSVGFNNLEFHYPMPDYKIPTQVFTDEFTPTFGQLSNISVCYDQDRKILFDEKLAYTNIINNKQFGFFANSFLIFASNNNSHKKNLYANFKREVGKKFQIETDVIEEDGHKYSKKLPISDLAKNHINTIYRNYEILNNQAQSVSNLNIARCEKVEDGIIFNYIDGENLGDVAQKLILSKNKKEFIEFMKYYSDLVKQFIPEKKTFEKYTSEQCSNIFGIFELENIECAKSLNIDLIMDNIIKNGENYTVIDYEFVETGYLPINYVIARTIFNLYFKYDKILLDMISKKELFGELGISEPEFEIYWKMEISFQNYVHENADYKIEPKYQKAQISMDNYLLNKTEKTLLKLKLGKRIYKLTKSKK